ncbi:MAG: hypothetical protein ACK5OX_18015 [Desertimonas sp.]
MENPSRRRVLTAGLTGAVATALIGSRVSATTPTEPPTTEGQGSSPDGTGPDGTEAPATTAPPTRPTDGDVTLLAFAQGAELAARDLYAAAIEAETSDDTGVLATARVNHQAAADALSAEIGAAAPQTADQAIVDQYLGAFSSGDITQVASAGYELENALVATHSELTGMFHNLDAASNIAAITIAEAQMAAVLADLAGNGADPDAVFDNSSAALSIPSEG